jgi:hypothetical protein
MMVGYTLTRANSAITTKMWVISLRDWVYSIHFVVSYLRQVFDIIIISSNVVFNTFYPNTLVVYQYS